LRHKDFQHSTTVFRAAKGDIVWQDGCVQHGVPIFPKTAELESWTILCVFNRNASEPGPFTDKAMSN
jgi:hypothetical protein